MAWHLGAKTRVLALGAAVGLRLCPPEGFPDGLGPCCSSRVSHALRTIWLHSGVAASRHLDPAAPEAQHQRAGHAILCRVFVPERGGAGPAPQHHEASHSAPGPACLRRGGKTRASQRKLGATSLGHSKRHQGLRREPLTSTSMALFDETEVEQEEPPEEMDFILHDDDDDDDAEDPESTGTAVAEAVVPSSTAASQARGRRTLLVSALRVRQESTET